MEQTIVPKGSLYLFKFSFFLSILGLPLTGCTKGFTEINANAKELTTNAISENPALLGQVFAQAEYGTIFSDLFGFSVCPKLGVRICIYSIMN